MKIKSIDYHSQRNDEHLGFMTATSNIFAKYQLEDVDVPDAFIAKLTQAIENEDVSYKIL